MRTSIIPPISKINTQEAVFSLSDFYLDESILIPLPIAPEIFDQNTPLSKANSSAFPISCLPLCSELLDEEYKISARADRIEISASTARGLMYALFTLSELSLANNGILNEFDAHDFPALKLRALSDDLSRGQISNAADFYRIIRLLARYKYNTYMPYIEDVFAFDCCEAWGRYSDPVSKEEWRAIIRYAGLYQLNVRPIVNLLGHCDKSSHIKEIQPLLLRAPDGSVSSVLDPTSEGVRPLISKMLRELVDCFGEGVIHCGGDEPTTLTEVFGKEEGGRLFIEHYTYISTELKKLNCSMMMYADFFAPPWGDYAVPVTRAKELPIGTEFVFWDYAVRDSYPFVDALHEQELPLYISPGSWTWQRLSCDIRTCYGNVRGLLKQDNGRACGMILSSWGDGGDILREHTWPGVLLGANFCWAPKSDYSYEDFFNLYHQSFFGFTEEQATPLEAIYHHDSLIKRENEQIFHAEFFRSPFAPVHFLDIESIGILQAAMRKARADIAGLTPLRNRTAFEALSLTVERALFCADKLAFLPRVIPDTLEETIPFSDKAAMLAAKLEWVKELHRKLWFNNNRASEWELCACRYDDQRDLLLMFSRQCKNKLLWEKK